MGEAKTTEPARGNHEKLQVKIQAFEDKINAEDNTPGSVRRYSLGHISKEEQRNIRFGRYNFCSVVILKYELTLDIASLLVVFGGILCFIWLCCLTYSFPKFYPLMN